MALKLNRLKSKISSFIAPEVRNFRFLIGQSAILSSRANSKSFESLWDAEVKIYSQWGEDGILDYLCERLGLSKPRMLEIGAGNFSECNSRFLAENRNASIFAVDGRDDLVSSIERNSLLWKNHIFAHQTWVSPSNINEIILRAQNLIGDLDIFSLDLDGNDYWILQEANLESVSIVVVEYNPLFGHLRAVSVPRDDEFDRKLRHHSWLYYGASLKAFEYLLNKKGFDFVGTNRVGNNAFFVRKELARHIPFSPENDFSIYTDWRVRETRSEEGRLTFTSGYDRVSIICRLPLIEVDTGKQVSVGEANPPNPFK
jgi:hypothetical protein